MKDDYKRRRKLERPLIRTLPDVDSTDVFTPVHQECLDMDCKFAFNMSIQGQEFIATSSDEWWLEVYGYSTENSTASFDLDSVSEISDDTVIPDKTRKALWRALPRGPELEVYGDVIFLASDVVGLVQLETSPATVSTWHVRSGQSLESVALPGDLHYEIMSKISDTEFVVGGSQGHLFSFEHEGGYNLRQTRCIWKAHTDTITNISFHNGIIVTTSDDRTARLWDTETKKRLAVLYHDEVVSSGVISDQYIVTCSRYGHSDWEKSELRIYRNSEGYPLTKILRTSEGMFSPTFINDNRVLCTLRGHMDDEYRHLVRNTLVVVDFENERMLARLKVACRGVARYEVLHDGRLVVIGHGGCCGVIATLPHDFRRLISPKPTEKQSKIGRRRMCTLM